jgi:NAD(P)-dependent dehydrogenase (short-subunit alcohol dehydrogenase family)
MSFVGKVVVVTGGSRGMGKEMVEAYAARGADVVVASRKLDNCVAVAVAVADAVRARRGVRALPVACNVSHWDSSDELPYAAAKAGLNALTEGWRRRSGLRFASTQSNVDRFSRTSPRRGIPRPATHSPTRWRCAEPHEIVGAAMYLTGDEASFCTGAVLRLDGGVP